jgi:predicted esterase
MNSSGKASPAALGIALLAMATVVLAGGRQFGGFGDGFARSADGAGKAREGGESVSAPDEATKLWLVVGPFRAAGFSGLDDPLDIDYLARAGLSPSGEGSAYPLRVGEESAKLWRETEGSVDPAEGSRGVDFIAEFGPTTDSVAYAFREVESEVAGEALLRLGSDDGVKLWVNGSLVLADHVKRALKSGEDEMLVPLAKGRNRILVKVGQAGGEWGFSLSFGQAIAGGGETDASGLRSLAILPDERCFPLGGKIGGALLPKPSPKGGIGREWAAEVELLDASGAIRASSEARVGSRFSLSVPGGLSGPLRIRARGAGRLASLVAPEAPLFLGESAASAERALALARSPAAAKTAAARFPEIPDPAATLEYLARGLEGSLPSSMSDFDLALQALREIDALAGEGRAGAFPTGLWRYAFASPADGSLQPYSLYLPPGYRNGRRLGLVLSLHGASQNDLDAARALAAAGPPDMAVLAPYCRGDQAYAGSGERDATDALDMVQSRYAIDPDRVYVCGSSMGGYGTWRLAKLYPWRFAAAAPFAGWTGTDMLENLGRMPLLVVHGDADPTVPIERDRQAVDFLRESGNPVRFEVNAGGGHDAFGDWTAEEGAGRLLSWLRRHRREAWPESIEERTTMPRAGRGAWASILGLAKPSSMAAIDARIVDERHVAVATDNVSAFELDLRHPLLAKGGRVLVLADGVNLPSDSRNPRARFELGADGRFVPAAPPAAGRPANGGSGIVALLDSPLRIVYGTRTRGSAVRGLETARAIAESMGKAGFGSVDISTDSDYAKAKRASAGNVLFVGDPDGNSALAAVAPELPIAWKGGLFLSPDGRAKGKGLVLVCPDPAGGGRLVGVLAPPSRGRADADFARALFGPLSFQSELGTCGYGTPDALILDAGGGAKWTGCFDWRWESLKERVGAGK